MCFIQKQKIVVQVRSLHDQGKIVGLKLKMLESKISLVIRLFRNQLICPIYVKTFIDIRYIQSILQLACNKRLLQILTPLQ